MLPAVHAHEDDVVFFVFLALRVLLLSVGERVLARLSVENVVEIFVQLHPWRVKIQEYGLLLLVVEQVVNLVLRLKLNDFAGGQQLVLAVPCSKLVAKCEKERAESGSLGIVTEASFVLPVPLSGVGRNQIEWSKPLAKRSIVLALVQEIVLDEVVVDVGLVIDSLIEALLLQVVLGADLSRVHLFGLGQFLKL